ncbi:nucleotide disphospho-sugar-binding domain-containing protein [Actinomadura geliboluensis]
MRVLFTPLAPTHYFHMVPLAWAFRAAGHEVRVAVQPATAGAVTGSGMIAVPVGGGYDFAANATASQRRIEERIGRMPRGIDAGEETGLSPDDLTWVNIERFGVLIDTARDVADDLAAFAAWWRPDLVVSDPLALAAPLASEPVGAPLLHHLWGFGAPGAGVPPEIWPPHLRELFERHGVEPRARYAAHHVDPFPGSLQAPEVTDRIPVRAVPYNGAGTVPEWLRRPADRRRIAVTTGTVVTGVRDGGGLLDRDLLDALAELDAEVVVTVRERDRELLGEPPAGVRVVAQLPLHLLLPTCSAILHHGGAGTVLASLYAGVPQLLHPEPEDYPMARALAGAGAAALLPETCTAADAVTALSALLGSDGPRAAADKLRAEIHEQPSPAEVAASLDELAG